LARFWRAFRISEGGVESPKPPPWYATAGKYAVRPVSATD